MIEGSLRGARALVLGGGGFIGRSLCHALVRAGAETHALGRNAAPEELPEAVTWHRTAMEGGGVRDAVRNMDFLFHLAGSSNPAASNVNPAGDVVETLIPSLRLLEACREAGAGRIVYASSGGTIYGAAAREAVTERHPTEPITAYGINKLAVEKYLALYRRLHGLDSIVLRISNPYGPFQERGRGQGAVGAFMWKALLGEPIEIFGDGSVVRDYIYVDDVAAAFLAVASYEGPERLFNVGSGEGRTLTQVAHDVQAASGRHGIEIQYKAGRPADVPFNILDASLLRQATSWSPNTGWQEGLAATAGWISRHLDGGR